MIEGRALLSRREFLQLHGREPRMGGTHDAEMVEALSDRYEFVEVTGISDDVPSWIVTREL